MVNEVTRENVGLLSLGRDAKNGGRVDGGVVLLICSM